MCISCGHSSTPKLFQVNFDGTHSSSKIGMNRDATSPFDASSRADIILRSEFLPYSSSVFSDMFTVPLPKQSDSDQATKFAQNSRSE